MRKIKTLLMVLCACLFMGAFSACKGVEIISSSDSAGVDLPSESQTENSVDINGVSSGAESADSADSAGGNDQHEHVWDDGSFTKQPTCEESGEKTYSCECGVTQTEEVAPLDHAYDDVQVVEEPTCTDKGRLIYTCTNGCEGWYEEDIAPLGHDYETFTLEVEGETFEIERCIRCKATKIYTYVGPGQIGEVHPHNYVDMGLYAATCTTKEITAWFKCTDIGCDKEIIKYGQDALGHDFGESPETHYDAGGHFTYCVRGCKVYVSDHEWETIGEVIAPTCTEDGIHSVRCTVCGWESTSVAPAHHVWNSGTVTVEPTCTESGVKLIECIRCDESYTENIPARGHSLSYTYDDSTHEGVCIRGGCDYEVFDKHHLTTENRVLDSRNDGQQIVYLYALFDVCHTCGYAVQLGDYGVGGYEVWHQHQAVEVIEGKRPTCTEEGYSAELRCAVDGCGEVLVASHILEKLPHEYGDGVVTTEPTCTEKGVKTFTCHCGDSYTEEVPALGHNYDNGAVTTEPTCTKKGVKTFTCHCGDIYTEDVPALGHAYNDSGVTTEPTCTENGVKTFTCHCGDSYIENVLALGHDYDDGVVTTEPTCTENGVKTFTCVNGCGDSYTEEVPALGHDYDDGVVTTEPTCTENGVKTFTCHCGDSYIENVLALGHDYDDGVVTREPTCTTIGVKTYTCHCGDSYTEDVPVLEHNYENKICVVCGVEQASEGLRYTLNADNISYSVTGIGTCTDTDLVIPSVYNNLPVTSIGDRAFENCDSLTSVDIPNSVTSIGNDAFEYCYSLTSVEIPDSVTSIGDRAFRYCISLTSVEIGDSVTSIGSSAFSECTSLTSVKIGDSVTGIGYMAFYYCTSLTSVEIGNSVTSIGGDAFRDCTSLTSVKIGDLVTSIGDCAFYNCDSLTSVVIPDSVTRIGNYAFYECTSLTSVEIPNSVTSIGYYAFYNCDSLTSVEIPNSVTSIANGLFSSCDSLTSVVIPDSVTSIGDRAFRYCISLTDIYYKGTAEEWDAISIDSNNEVLENVTKYYYTEIQPTEEGNWWHYVDGEPTVWEVLPASQGLEYALNDDGVSYAVTGIGTCEDTDLVIPSTYNDLPVVAIGDSAFYNSASLTSVIIPASVENIGNKAFSSCALLTNILVSNNNTAYQSIDGNLYTKDGTTLVQYAIGKSLTTFSIPSSVTHVGSWAFSNAKILSLVTLSDSVESIGERAFFSCRLSSINFGAGLTDIGNYAFCNCDRLTLVTIPDSVINIGHYAFLGCLKLKTVVIGEGVISIGCGAFSDCEALTTATFKNTSHWYRVFTEENWKNKTGGTLVDVNDKWNNASAFGIYAKYYWYKL